MKITGSIVIIFIVILYQSLEISSCPDQCKCGQVKSGVNVDCSNKNFDTIPNGIPNNTVKLDLSRNKIANIGDSSFSSLSMLTDLKLSSNEIKTISPTAFNGLASLQNLYMVHCGLSNWNEGLLSPLKKLSALYLTDNNIKTIPNITSPSLRKLFLDKNKFTSLIFPDKFKQNTNLQSLVLSNNNISQIGDDDFAALKDLPIKSLKLSECQFKKISSKALSNLAQLKTLDLNSNGLVSDQLDLFLSQITSKLETLSINNNSITSLSANTFAKLANGMLNILQVDGNPLNLIDPQAFAPLTRLTHLSLRHCKFSSIGSALQPLTRLTNLFLSNNSISEVPNSIPQTLQLLDMSTTQLQVLPSHVLENVTNLKVLSITNSSLVTIESEAFLVNENSKNVVDFSNNYFKCDCSLAWFRNWIDGTKVSVVNKQQYLCGSPASLKGRPLLSFSAANCSQPSTSTRTIAPTSAQPTSTRTIAPTSAQPTSTPTIAPTSAQTTHSEAHNSTIPVALESKLSVAAIVFIVIGCLAIVAAIVVFLICRFRNQSVIYEKL